MKRTRQTGYAIILTTLALVALLGIMGFGIDMGMMRYERRLQQTAADAAAIAGANDLAFECGGTPCGSVTSAAQNASAANGFTDGTNNVTVHVYNPPTGVYWAADPHKNNNAYVEVVISAVHPTYFEKILSINNETVVARAEATYLSGASNNDACMYTLGNPANEIGVDPFGSTTLNATTCGIVDNGNFDPTGKGLTVNTCSFNVSGSNTGNNSGNVYCNGQTLSPNYSSPTAQDPFLGQLTTPSNPGASTSCPAKGTCNVNTTGTVTLQPGQFSSISIGSSSNVTFSPGIYYINGSGGLSCTGSPTITGTGVMFYFTNSATINCQGSASINLTAMTSAQAQSSGYPKDAGILMYQDPNDTNTGIPTKGSKSPCPPPGSGTNTGPQMGGNDGSTYHGVLYFPADQLYLTGNTTTGAGVSIGASVTDTVCIGGNSTFNLIGASGLPAPLPTLSNTVLVE